MAVLDWLRRNLWLPLGALYLVALWVNGQNQWDGGYKKGKAEGDAAVADLRLVHAEQARQAAIDSRVQLLQQIERANQAEALLLSQQAGHDQDHQQLQERIPHVTTVYRPAPAAAPVVIPRCVFTAGWVRDFNLALGAGLPAAKVGTEAASAAQEAWPAPGTDAELLESGVTQADILAYAQDYGRWARNNLAQLNALLDLQKD